MISWIIDENDYYFILGSMLTDKTLLSYWCDFEKTVIQGKYCSLQRKKNMNKSAIKTKKNHGINFVHILLFKHSQLWDSADLALLYFPETLEIFQCKINYIM